MTLNKYGPKQTHFLWVCLLIVITVPASFAQTAGPAPVDNSNLENAVVWQQTSGERRALSYQAFALARMMLDRDLRMNRRRIKRAIIVDLDETIIDNTRYEARLIKERMPHISERYTDWINLAECEAVPGSLEFLRYANSRGVRVFYITNRKQIEREGTARNLVKLGFPKVNDETLLVKPEGSSSKEPRRQAVNARYHVVLLMGDNLNDFAAVFEDSKTVASRNESVERNKAQFGTRFIVLPNPMYGDWESAIYDYNLKRSAAEKGEKRRSALKDY